MRVPSCDQLGLRSSNVPHVNLCWFDPSGAMAQMSYPPSRYAKKVIHLPSGDQVGWRASLTTSVIRVAGPPDAGRAPALPCSSTASVRPSGDTATDIDVPS